MEKRCGICNCLNSLESIYCKKCGHFLCKTSGAMSDRGQAPKSIWEIDEARSGGAGRIAGGKNYIFQESDKPFQPTAAGENTTIKLPEPKRMIKGRGPMRFAKEDHSFLRFIGVQGNGFFVLEMHQEEEILGTSGTAGAHIFQSSFFHDIKPQQLKISHSPVGWYLQAMDGKNVWNGDWLQRGMSRRLADGDFIYMGNCMLRVELLYGQENSSQMLLSGVNHSDCRHSVTSLRLLGTSNGSSFIWNAKTELNVLSDESGTNPHLQIWYCADGQWHIRPLGSMVLLNGVELNQGFEYVVHNGDQINMKKYILQVEITERIREGG